MATSPPQGEPTAPTPGDGVMAAVTDVPAAEAGPVATARPSTAGAAYTTFVLALVFMLANMDRNVMNILLVPIQKELKVSDTMMGAISGTAFSLVYAVAALPLGWLADRRNRRNILAGALAVWSGMTALCGVTVNYLTLLLARIGVAAGEAALYPAAMSLAGDLYPRRRRGLSVGVMMVGGSIGIGAGAFIAGRLNDLYGWRPAFIALGLPGLLVAGLMLLTVREPPRGAQEGGARVAASRLGVWRSLRYVLGVPTVVRLLSAKLVMQVAFNGFLVWAPAFFMRVHHMSATEMSALFGASVGIGAIFSQLLAGFASDWLTARGERWRAYWCTLSLWAGLPFMLMVIFGSTPMATLGMFGISVVAGGATTTSLVAGLGVVRPAMRGFMTAMMMVCIQGVGGGLGPLVIGALNDVFKRTYGDEAIRHTLMLVPACWLLAGLLFWFAGRTADRDAELALADPEMEVAR